MAKDVQTAGYGIMTRRQRLEMLRVQLENERSSFIADWRDLGEYIQPRRPRFFVSDNNKGQRRNQKIIDSTASLSIRTLKSGMMGGITSPARPWMRLDVPDPKLASSSAVKQWLHATTEKMLAVFLRSNLYNALPILYGDMGGFGTGAMLVEEDLDEVFRCSVFPIGSYCIALDDKLRVNTFYRTFQLTVAQVTRMFGKKKPGTEEIDWKNFNWENFSTVVRIAVDNNQFQQKIDIRHFVTPNDDYDPRAVGARGKRYSSVYYEAGSGAGTNGGMQVTGYEGPDLDKFLRISGYDMFPVLCPRWEVSGEDVYGTDCPATTCIGDVKALQVMQKRLAQAIEKMVNPPMTGPTALRNTKTSLLPGDITYQDVREGQLGFRPIHEVQFRIQELEGTIKSTQGRIQRAFYEDLFLMMSSDENVQPITATEVNERHEEKLLALGPVLEGLNQDVLNPLVDLVFSFMVKQGLIDAPPPELHGIALRVEYTSIMAQAQKLLGLSSIERFAQFAGQTVAAFPASADVIDADQMLIDYGDKTSIAPNIIRDMKAIALMRQQRAQQQQAQAQQQQQMNMSQTAKNLAQAPTDGDNALTQLLQQGNAGNMVPQR